MEHSLTHSYTNATQVLYFVHEPMCLSAACYPQVPGCLASLLQHHLPGGRAADQLCGACAPGVCSGQPAECTAALQPSPGLHCLAATAGKCAKHVGKKVCQSLDQAGLICCMKCEGLLETI